MDRISNQNSDENIRLLSSQRYFYTKSKENRILKLFCAIVLVVVSPMILLQLPQSKEILCFIGAIGIILTFIIEFVENGNIKRAANIQEQFDVGLFGLDWNQFLAGAREPIEVIITGEKKFKGDKSKLYDWYGDLSDINFPYNVLLCQRSNLVWDWRLRKKFAVIILILLTFMIGTGIGIGLVYKMSFKLYLMGIFIPSIPAIIFGLKEVFDHFRIANEKIRLMHLTNSMLEKKEISNFDLRQIQDRIFGLRTRSALIPDWFYKSSRNEYEINLAASNEDFRSKLMTLKN